MLKNPPRRRVKKARGLASVPLRFLVCATALALCLLLPSCSKKGYRDFSLPETSPLSGAMAWAVVKDAYVRLRAAPSASAADLDHLRGGGVFEVSGREMGGPAEADKGMWYKLKVDKAAGWARESELDVYPSREQALRASERYR